MTTKNSEIPVADGSVLPVHVALPAGEPAHVAVIVAHELFGVNPDIREILDRLASDGHLAMAPEFYHRNAPAGQWFERDESGRAEGFRQLHLVEREPAVADVAASMDWLLEQPGIETVAMLGFSAGGHLAYLAATQLPIDRTVVLYGGWLRSTDIPMSRPQPTLELTGGIRGELLYLVGGDDALISPDERTQIGSALETARVRHQLVSYPGVQHAFFWPGTPAYDGAARADAWDRIRRLLSSRRTTSRSAPAGLGVGVDTKRDLGDNFGR